MPNWFSLPSAPSAGSSVDLNAPLLLVLGQDPFAAVPCVSNTHPVGIRLLLQLLQQLAHLALPR